MAERVDDDLRFMWLAKKVERDRINAELGRLGDERAEVSMAISTLKRYRQRSGLAKVAEGGGDE